jgi:hypothetical protein
MEQGMALLADIEVKPELLRHATMHNTMNVCTQAIAVQKHIASSVVERVPLNIRSTRVRITSPHFFSFAVLPVQSPLAVHWVFPMADD